MASNKRDVEKVNLLEWIKFHRSEEQMRELFLNMDIALNYIHDHDYCIEVFYPTKIQVLNNRPDYIQFDNLMELPKNDPVRKKNMIKEDIFNSALIQIGLYTKTLKYLTPEFLRNNFDDLARFIPEGDIPYYRGVVQRGASVYFNEYAVEKMNRDLETLEAELQGAEGGKSLQKTDTHYDAEPLENNKINDAIYKQINGLKEAAFVSYLLIPTVIFASLFIIGFISWLLSLI